MLFVYPFEKRLTKSFAGIKLLVKDGGEAFSFFFERDIFVILEISRFHIIEYRTEIQY